MKGRRMGAAAKKSTIVILKIMGPHIAEHGPKHAASGVAGTDNRDAKGQLFLKSRLNPLAQLLGSFLLADRQARKPFRMPLFLCGQIFRKSSKRRSTHG